MKKKKVIEVEEVISDDINKYVCQYKNANKIAAHINESLDIFAFNIKEETRVIAVQHDDGSYLEFHSACFRKIDDDFFAVFTEHHDFHVYHKEDVKWIKEYASPKYLYYNDSM